MEKRQFPKGCTITNIGFGTRVNTLYGELRSPTGELLISATLEYIFEVLQESEFVDEV